MLRFPSLTSLTSAGFDQSSLLGDNFASLLDVSVFDSGGNELKAAPVTKRTELTAEFQVWSLTQFYSVDFKQSRIVSAFSTNAQSRFALVVKDSLFYFER